MSRASLPRIVAIVISLAVSLAVIELALRLQPWIKLGGFELSSDSHPIFHHAGPKLFIERTFGEHCGDAPGVKVLLLGDSWMQDQGLAGVIGEKIAGKLGKCVLTVNGAFSSYSPTLYLLKAKHAVESYGRFDYVFVNVDETDIGNEWLQYRGLIMRDRAGAIVAVPSDVGDLGFRDPFQNGFLWVQESSLYSIRLVRKIIHTRLFMPHLHRLARPIGYEDLMKFVFFPDTRQRHSRELQYFHERLAEMAETLIAATGNKDKVYVTHHPHAKGVMPSDDGGVTYLPIVSEALAALHDTHAIRILDARAHVRQIHGNRQANEIYMKDDPFSHLAGDASKRYGAWIVENMWHDSSCTGTLTIASAAALNTDPQTKPAPSSCKPR